MSAGTLTLTNSADAVTGSGTSFTTELAAGDFIVVTVGGIPYTLPVKTVNNNTSLTLVSVYTGPTQSGAAWSAVPRVTLNMVTAALVAQSAEALRGLNYDKQNWQSIFSGTGNITIKLPDGSAWNGPSWNNISETLNQKASSGANRDITSIAGLTTPLSLYQGGTGGNTHQSACNGIGALQVNRNVPNAGDPHLPTCSFFLGDGQEAGGNGKPYSYSTILNISESGNTGENGNYSQVSFPSIQESAPRIRQRFAGSSPRLTNWRDFLVRDLNTSVDTNGFIKIASPVVKIYADGSFDVNNESEGITVTRLAVGEYLISGCLGMNADAAWGGTDGGFDIPLDINKQPRIWLDYEVNTDGSILVKTYHRTHPQSPKFARNEIDNLTNGDPIDIPSDSFVSVRVEMPADSIWNQKQEAVHIAMVEARMKEERTDGNNV
ncbi:phage tail protein [Salmonella enterica]|nr:phage tail protein [Salmonella enterica]EBI9896554.1 phage tail protein [Salmonella enterica]EMB3734147.1 phage tail protein [Salmonella enterica]